MAPVKPGSAIGHTARYLADRIRAKKAAKEKRKAGGMPEIEDDESRPAAKKIYNAATEEVDPQEIEDLKIRAFQTWTNQMQAGTDDIYKTLYGQHWEEGKKYELEKLSEKQADHRRQQAKQEAAHGQRMSNWEKSHAAVADSGVYKDDYDPRY